MTPTIEAEFDGRVFVPKGPVDLPAGTRVMIPIVPTAIESPWVSATPPPPLTEEERRQWEEVCRQILETEPEFPTVEEALRYSRGRP